MLGVQTCTGKSSLPAKLCRISGLSKSIREKGRLSKLCVLARKGKSLPDDATIEGFDRVNRSTGKLIGW